MGRVVRATTLATLTVAIYLILVNTLLTIIFGESTSLFNVVWATDTYALWLCSYFMLILMNEKENDV